MPTRFDLPSLSDKTYASLQQELTAAIPQYSRQWTDFNPSNPGIALLQLLCWLGDMTLYRIDTVPREFHLNLLRWVVGASGPELARLIKELAAAVVRDAAGQAVRLPPRNVIVLDPDRLALARYLADLEAGAAFDPADLRARVVAYWQAPYRLVTSEDFAAVTQSVTGNLQDLAPGYAIGRVVVQVDTPWIRVLPVIDYPWKWSRTKRPDSPSYKPGMPLAKVTAALRTGGLMPAEWRCGRVLQVVRAYLEPRRLLGTPVAVEPPVVTPIAIHVQLAALADRQDPWTVGFRCCDAVQALLSPLTGGPDGTGWPYDHPVMENDVRAALLGVDGVDANQPVQIVLETVVGLRVGKAVLGWSGSSAGPPTYLGHPGRIGLPQLWLFVVEVLDKSYGPIQIGVCSTVGVDTRFPLRGVWP